MAKTEAEKAIDASLAELAKSGMIVRRLGEDERLSQLNIEVVKTGSLGLDHALGVGGYPKGRIIEMMGMESSGKSTMALLSIAEVQKAGGRAAYIDAENGFSWAWAKNLGVTKELYMNQPENGEEAFEVVEKLAKTNQFSLIIVDSTAALVPRAELEATMDQKNIGMQAQLISKGLRKIIGIVGRSNTAVIFINQFRKNVMQLYGDPNVTPGGMALKFYCSVRIKVGKLGGKENIYFDADGKEIGHRVKCHVVKNKVSSPGRSCEFDLYFDRGIDIASELPELVVSKGIVTLEGKTYRLGDSSKWVGMPAFKEAVSTDPKLVEVLKGCLGNAEQSVGQE